MADDNVLEILFKATTNAFDAAIAKSKQTVTTFKESAEKDAESIKTSIERIETAGKSLNGVFSEMVEAFAGGKIIEFFKGIAEASGDVQARIISLDQALATMGDTASGTGQRLEEFADNLSKASGTALPEIIQGMTKFIGLGASADQSMYLSTLAANIHARSSLSLSTAQQVLARSIETGSLASFARLGLGMKGVNLRTVDLNVGIAAMAKQLNGAAAASAQGLEGTFNRLAQSLEGLKVVFGNDFLSPLTAIGNNLIWLVTAFEAMSPAARHLIEVIGLAVGAFSALSLILPLVLSSISAFMAIFSAETLALVLSPLGLIIAGITSIGVAVFEAVTHWKAFLAIVAGVEARLRAFFAPVVAGFEMMRAAVSSFIEQFAPLYAAVISYVDAVIQLAKPIVQIFGTIAQAILSIIRPIGIIALGIITVIALGLVDFGKDAIGVVAAIVAFVGKAATQIATFVLNVLTSIANGFARLARSIVSVLQPVLDTIAKVAAGLGDIIQKLPVLSAFAQVGNKVVSDASNAGRAVTGAVGNATGGLGSIFGTLGKRADAAKRSVADYIKSLTAGGKVEVPKMNTEGAEGDLDALGGGKKKKGDGASKAESDRLGNLKQDIADQLDPYKSALSSLTDSLDIVSAKEDTTRAAISETGETFAQYSALLDTNTEKYKNHIAAQAINTAEIGKERDVLRELEAERNRTAGNPKLAAQHRELIGLVRAHADAIDKLRVAVAKEGADAAKTMQERLKLEEEYSKQLTQIKLDAAKRDDAARQDQQAALERDLTLAARARSDAAAQASQAQAIADAKASGPSNPWVMADPRASAEENVATTAAASKDAQADVEAADKLRAMAAAAVAAATANVHYGENAEILTAHLDQLKTATANLTAQEDAVHAATMARMQAEANATIAQINLANIQQQMAVPALTQLSAKLIQAVPQLGEFLTIIQHSASPMQALGNIFAMLFEQTQSFKDIITIVSNIFVVVARVLDAIFLPIIKVIASVLTSVVNVFIGLYNIVAMLVGVFGIHIQRLQYINSLLDNLSGSTVKPLLDVVHDLPTPKEYGAGKWGPLTSSATNVTGGLLSAINQQTTNQGTAFGNILKFLAVLAVIDWLTNGKFLSGLFGTLTNWFPGLKGLFSNIGSGIQTAWNSASSAITNFMGSKLAGALEIGAGFALLDGHATGIVGVLEKILGVLFIVQGIMQIISSTNSLFGSGSGGIGGLVGGISKTFSKLFGGGGSGGVDPFTSDTNPNLSNSADPSATNWDPASAYGGGASASSSDPFSTNWDPASAYAGSDIGAGGVAFGNGLTTDVGLGGGSYTGGADYSGGYSGPDMNNSSFGSYGNDASASGRGLSLGGAAAGIGAGLSLGQLFGGLFGGGSHTSNGSMAGALGGGIGGLVGGPVGGLIGAGIGSLIGSLFGHKDNPATMPDKYDTTRFTQMVGELQGSAGTAYGAAYNPGGDQVQQTLGMPMLQAIQTWTAANENSQNPTIRGLAQQLKGQYGDSPQGLAFGSDIGNESVKGGSLSGTYVTIWNAASAAIQQIATTVAGVQNSMMAPTQSYNAPAAYANLGNPVTTRTTSSSIVQNNTIGSITGANLSAVDASIGTRLAVLARTQRFSSF